MEHSQAPLEITTEKIEYPGFAQFVIALGLGACNTLRVPAKSEIPGSLAKPQVFAPPPLRKSLEHRPLPTCLTTTKKHPAKQPNISGFSEVWYRAWFGTKRPWVQVPQPGPKIGGRFCALRFLRHRIWLRDLKRAAAQPRKTVRWTVFQPAGKSRNPILSGGFTAEKPQGLPLCGFHIELSNNILLV